MTARRGQSLADAHPEVAAQWHPRNLTGRPRSTPDTVPCSAPDRVWWRCSQGHEWQERVQTRTLLPQWKGGDRAACPTCVRLPAQGRVRHTFPGCGHTREVREEVTRRGYSTCWTCHEFGDSEVAAQGRAAVEAARLERKRAAARESYRRRQARGGRKLTDEQRTAQQALVGFTNVARTVMADEGVVWQRPPDGDPVAAAWGTSTAGDLTGWLIALEVPHRSAVGVDARGRVACGVMVTWEDLPALGYWLPSFVRHLNGALHAADPALPRR